MDRGGATRRRAVRHVVYFNIFFRTHSQLTHLGTGTTGGARRRQATIGCCWGMGVATAGGSSAWTMLPDVTTWTTLTLHYYPLFHHVRAETVVGSAADLGALCPLGGFWRNSRGQVEVRGRSFQLSVRNLNLLFKSIQNLIRQEKKNT